MLLFQFAVVLLDLFEFVETIRSSATEPVLRDTVDHVPLVTADIVAPLLERCLDVRLELAECSLVAAEEFAAHGVVGHVEWERFDVGDIDERGVRSLQVAREETPILEPLVGGEVVGEFDGEVEVGRRARVTHDLQTEHHREFDVRIAAERLLESRENLRAPVVRVHTWDNVVSFQKNSAILGSVIDGKDAR